MTRRVIGSIRWFSRRRRLQPARLIRRPVHPTACGRVNAPVQRRAAQRTVRCNRLLDGAVNGQNYSAVVGSITVLISEMRLAGKPPFCACSLINASFGAIYTQ